MDSFCSSGLQRMIMRIPNNLDNFRIETLDIIATESKSLKIVEGALFKQKKLYASTVDFLNLELVESPEPLITMNFQLKPMEMLQMNIHTVDHFARKQVHKQEATCDQDFNYLEPPLLIDRQENSAIGYNSNLEPIEEIEVATLNYLEHCESLLFGEFSVGFGTEYYYEPIQDLESPIEQISTHSTTISKYCLKMLSMEDIPSSETGILLRKFENEIFDLEPTDYSHYLNSKF